MAFRLKPKFEQILKNYQPSPEALSTVADLKLVLIIGATSTGRNTIIRELLKSGDYYFIVSDTTRQPRINDGIIEKDGDPYWFRSEEEVLADLQAGQFLEAEIVHRAQVSGINIRELQKAKAENKVAITDIEVGGAHNILKIKPDTILILLLPPSFSEWQRRIRDRGHMPPEVYAERMQSAAAMFKTGFDEKCQYVVADNIEHGAKVIDQIAHGKPNPDQARGAKILRDLNQEIKTVL